MVIENEINSNIFNPFYPPLNPSPPTLACIGAKSVGMGDAYVNAVDDVTAVYWNPATLV
jgi:hypothetical protein